MRKLMTLVLLLTVTTMSFAQKDEIKAIEKAIKGNNWSDAQSAVAAAEQLTGNMDDKTKAKFYYLKAQALYANGAGSTDNIDKAITTLDDLKQLESSIGKLRYTDKANDMKTEIYNSYLKKANEAFDRKDMGIASQSYEKIYNLSTKDTIYLYYSAVLAAQDGDYDRSLKNYIKLKDLGYTGIRTNWIAVNKETGQEDYFPGKDNRDFAVKTLKTHTKPSDRKEESKRAEIVKNIALIYVAQGKDEMALAAMSDARSENPDDMGLLLSEANVYLKMGNKERFKELMEEATQKDPDNAELTYNLGVLAAEAGDQEEAIKFYKKAISLDPNYLDAYTNIAVSILDGESEIVEEMNSLGMSAADNKRYDELKAKRTEIYQSAIPYLQKAFELNESNIQTAQTLMNIYSQLGETAKYKEMKVIVDELEAAATGN